MAKFESSLGSKKIQPSQMREFEVSDETSNSSFDEPSQEELHEVRLNAMRAKLALDAQNAKDQIEEDLQKEREFQEARKAKISGKERLNDGAKKRIEMLLGITKLTREVEIKDTTFILRTLQAKEMRAAVAKASEFDGTIHSPFEIRRQLLARSLTHIAGIEVSQFIGSDSLEQKLLFIDELDDTFLTRLYTEYTILAKESKDQYSVKTAEEAKEVVQDIKK